MKVLILPSWYPSSPADCNGVFFREQAIALSRIGCQVSVLSANLSSFKNIRQWRLKVSKPKVFEDELVQTFRVYGSNLFPCLPRLREKWQAHLLKNLYTCYERDNGRPDLIHVHSMLPAGLAALELWNSRRIPYVITEHSTAFARRLLSDDQISKCRKIASCAQERWAVSPTFARKLEQELGSVGGRWGVMPNIVARPFLETPLPNRCRSPFVFLNVCFHTPIKKVDLLLRAFAQEFRSCNDVILQLAGSGPHTAELIRQSSQLGIADKVQFLGMLSRDQVLSAMAGAHAFVLSSQVETFGVVLIEALAMGLPLLATRCGGPEYIVTESNGILVENGDIEQLAAALLHLKYNISRYKASELRRECAERFSEDSIIRILNESYHSVLANHQKVDSRAAH
ncbi:glycosyltransferase [Cyanobium sp. Maggiore-St4-Cus]|uniref:glycosyltransferase n=1 Tax=Cyanobium sp. Maggiore-St4-Cus TaxID=2823717 RepID=UPI0020CE43FA|nr:glycosyltransferase [Cyanobium sp. Maggiore-St4-Cus]MCP9788991.1 glycosyltransferase [Cyanobium sp. Maggiore-St4-Cus]